MVEKVGDSANGSCSETPLGDGGVDVDKYDHQEIEDGSDDAQHG